jgi:hypothetical protein
MNLSMGTGSGWSERFHACLWNPYRRAQAESFAKALNVEDIYAAGYEIRCEWPSYCPVPSKIYNDKRLRSGP